MAVGPTPLLRPTGEWHMVAIRREAVSMLIISTAMTVDGVMSVEDWYVPEGGHDRAGMEQLHHAAALLLGRKNYEGLAAFWSPMTGEWADLSIPSRSSLPHGRYGSR